MTAVQPHPSISRDPLPLDAENLATVCVLCSHNCGLRVDVRGGRIDKVRADESNPITHGYLCNKAYAIPHYAHHAQRLEHPLRRTADGHYERASWDEAIADIAARLKAIHGQHGPRSIGIVGIGGQANHLDGAFALQWLGSLGSLRWFNALAQEKHQHFLVDSLMFDSPPSVWFHPDIEGADHLLVMGTNPRISNRGHNPNDTFKKLAEDPDKTMVVVDPRETETTRQADRHLQIRPGTDAYLLLGMAAVIASGEGLADARFVAERTTDFEVLRDALSQVDVEEMARRCDLTPADLVETAREYAQADKAALMWDLAVEQQPFSTLISYLIRVLAVLTGNVGQPGGSLFMETITPPERSPRRFDEPERTVAAGIRGIPAMGGFPMFSPTLVPEEVLTDHPERLRAVIVDASNPLLSYSDTSRWREAFEKLELSVVLEPSWTETCAVADWVLPTPVGYEKWELAIFPKGYPEIPTQVRPPVIPAPGEALPEHEIYVRLAEAMGLVPEPPEELEALCEHALEPEGAAALFGALAGAGPIEVLCWTYRALGPRLPSPALVAVWALCHQNAFLRADSIVRTLGPDWEGKNPFELAAEIFRRILAHPEGVEMGRLDPAESLDRNIGWEDGRIRLAPQLLLDEIPRALETSPETDPDFPLVLAAGLRTRWTANTIQRDPAWRKGRGPHCSLNLSPADAGSLGIADGDRVRVSTRRGSVELPAALDQKLRTGHVWIPNGFGAAYPKGGDGELEVQGANTNELTDVADRDPISGCPHHKYTLCRVEKVEA